MFGNQIRSCLRSKPTVAFATYCRPAYFEREQAGLIGNGSQE